jgi:hypothetical protein
MFDVVLISDEVGIITYATIFPQRLRVIADAYPFVHWYLVMPIETIAVA